MNKNLNIEYAKQLDLQDNFNKFQSLFHIENIIKNQDGAYFSGNSLGLMPKDTSYYINEELSSWSNLAVAGHTKEKYPWVSYHEILSKKMAAIVSSKENEIIVMNSLTINLHLMLVSFYHPTKNRYKILIEKNAFPSDQFAIESHIKHWNLDPDDTIIYFEPINESSLFDMNSLLEIINKYGEEIAVIMLPGVHYYNGQVFNMKTITEEGHKKGCIVGFDLAHAVGNIPLFLHEWNVDFAVWCTYKYLNSGPGSTGGCFIHEKHASNTKLNRYSGWWGHNKKTRFNMENIYDLIPTAEGWQASNAPILSMAAIHASLNIFTEAGGISNLWNKTIKMIEYITYLLKNINFNKYFKILTPTSIDERGSQISFYIYNDAEILYKFLIKNNIICDLRKPNVIRIALVPLYVSYTMIFNLIEKMKEFFGIC